MENFVFLLVVGQTALAFGLENNQNDCLVFANDSASNSATCSLSRRGPRSLMDYLENGMSSAFWPHPHLKDNSQCKIDMSVVLQEAEDLNLWALKMLDASAKLPSGILNGNLNQYGDFDECLASHHHSNNSTIQGKYCLANIEIKIDKTKSCEKVQILDDVIHSHRMLTNVLKDPGHRIPKTETFNWGICIPASCSREEVERALNDRLSQISRENYFQFEASISEETCYVRESKEFSVPKLGVICLFLIILILIILGTSLDVKNIVLSDLKLTKILHCFSLRKNWSLLLRTNSTDDDIKCLHGFRFFNAMALLASHKQIAMLFNPIPNRTAASEMLGKSWSMLGRSAILYTDSFILFSGLLASYSMTKDLDKKKSINFKDKLITRIVRFTPNLVCTILFCTYIMEDMNSGPQWGLVVTKYTTLCKKYMWRNILYIHNYFGFENMCLTHTHQLGIDMQLFLVSPIFVFILWKWTKIGSLILLAVSVASTWLRYQVTYRESLSTLLYFGISVERLWKTANLSYILPTHRLTVYLTGIILGYFLRRNGKNLKFSQLQLTTLWFLTTMAGIYSIFGPYKAAFKDYVYDAKESAQFNAFAPILWIVFVTWVILACVNGYGGWLNVFLSWKYFTIFTRISYAIYLTQFPVFFYNVGSERSLQHFNGFHSLFDLIELTVILIASVMMTLAFDLPFQELRKLLMNSPKTDLMGVKEDDEMNAPQVKDAKEEEQVVRRRKLQNIGE